MYIVSRDSRFGRVEILLWFSVTKSDSSGSRDGVARGSGLSRKSPRKMATPVASRREVPYVLHTPPSIPILRGIKEYALYDSNF